MSLPSHCNTGTDGGVVEDDEWYTEIFNDMDARQKARATSGRSGGSCEIPECGGVPVAQGLKGHDEPADGGARDQTRHNSIKYHLCKHARSGSILAYVIDFLANLLATGLVVYKVGITVDPNHRFFNRSYGYVLDGYTNMAVLFQGGGAVVAMLEAAVILHHKGKPGFRNDRSGGEGFFAPDMFLYVVWFRLEQK